MTISLRRSALALSRFADTVSCVYFNLLTDVVSQMDPVPRERLAIWEAWSTITPLRGSTE